MKKSMITFITFLFLLVCSTLNAQTQLGNDIGGEAAIDVFGATVALSADGNRMAASALRNDAAGEDAGNVRIFEYIEDNWVQLGSAIEGTAAGETLGVSISFSDDGNRLASGAIGADNSTGKVSIHQYDGNDWIQLGSAIKGVAPGNRYGISLSLSADGNRIVIGAQSGYVEIFEYDGNDWIQLGSTISSDEFLNSVDMSADGNRIAFGLESKNNNTGEVQVFDYMEETWSNVGTMNGTSEGDIFGRAVALSADGSRLAIGAPRVDDFKGEIRLFEVFFDTLWVKLSGTIKGVSAGDRIGFKSLALSADGTRLATTSAIDAGYTRIFDYQNSDWTQVGMTINGAAAGDNSGAGLAMSDDGNRVAIGAPGNDDTGESAGHVRVFDLSVLTDIQGLPQLSLQFYPNPVRNILHIKGEQMTGMQARILDLSGKILLQQNLSKPEIDLSELSTGTYFLWLNTEQGVSIQMIVKE